MRGGGEKRSSRLHLGAWLVCACLGISAVARADAGDGDGEGIGPVFGYSNNRSWSFGWEASIERGAPVFKASIGGVYHVAPQRDDPFTIHYLVFEPWLFVGGTLGFGIADGPHVARPAYGVWEGIPVSLEHGGDPLRTATPARREWMLTFTFGWRGFGPTSQIYFTPKLWSYAPVGIFR
jgi:hypothetical protein